MNSSTPGVVIVDLVRGGDLLETRPDDFGSVLSIGWDRELLPRGWQSFVGPRHRMLVSDVSVPDRPSTDATFDAVRAAVQFFPQVVEPLLLHCFAGWSRSPAVALLYLAWRAGPGREVDAVRQLGEIARTAPNHLIVAAGDVVLGRDGRLFRALLASDGYDRFTEILALYDWARHQ